VKALSEGGSKAFIQAVPRPDYTISNNNQGTTITLRSIIIIIVFIIVIIISIVIDIIIIINFIVLVNRYNHQ
jgi:hypothetical protein